uniref:Ribokinase n=1 Tax=Globisporangium ultimum (strain ATCC 200006 / CBS 805.95 / DAOM BR144) TaxID=431595 RepID=K3X8K3_GLOUD
MAPTSAAARHVLIVGSVNADIVVEIDRLPVRGETVAANRPDTGKFVPGGKGANQAAAAARLVSEQHNLQTKFAGQFGNDTHGDALRAALSALDVDSSLAGRPACPSGQAFVFVYPDGDNSIVIVGGANATWPAQLPESLVDAIQSAAIVLLQCEIPEYVNVLVAQAAAHAGVPVMWDSGGEDRKIPDDVLPLITYLCPNETELARLAGENVQSIEDAVAVARVMQAKGAQALLVTLGSQGSVFVPPASAADADVVHQPCFKVDNVVDTTGAGDCFRGAFAVAIAEGKSVKESLKQAAAASALCVQVAGAMPSMPSAAQVASFLQAQS